MCDMNGMRCARVEPEQWDFYQTDLGRMFQDQCNMDPATCGSAAEDTERKFYEEKTSGKNMYCVQDWECNEGRAFAGGQAWYVRDCMGGGMYGSAAGLAASFAIAAGLAVAI